MNKEYTDITLVVDRSGSMVSMRQDAEGGINTFIEEQKKAPGIARLTLVEFDDEASFIHSAVNIAAVEKYTLHPRGCTALLDAVGTAIQRTGKRLEAMPESERPGLVTFVVVTDGQENASKEFRRDAIKAMIKEQQDKYNWKFIYLGANQDSFTEAGNMGFVRGMTANYDPQNVTYAYHAASTQVLNARADTMREAPVSMGFTEEDRKGMEGK